MREGIITGVYRIRNKRNGKSYIGVSLNVEQRFKKHLRTAEANTHGVFYIHKAIIKYGESNFEFSVLEECEADELFERERYYIKKYDSFNKGYNLTEGGDGFMDIDNPKAKLSYEEVVKIRKAYRNKDFLNPRRAKEEMFPDLEMESRNFSKVFHGLQYSSVMPEVFTEELFEHYKNNEASSYSNPGSEHGNAVSNEKEVMEIRVLFNFLTLPELLLLFPHPKGTINHWVHGSRYAHIPIFRKRGFYWDLPVDWTRGELKDFFQQTYIKYEKEIKNCLNRKNVVRNFGSSDYEEILKNLDKKIKIKEDL